jgi:hypothetical protein
MAPQPKSKSLIAALPARRTRARSTTGAGITGAGSGALLLHILKGYQDQIWAQSLLYLAPSISLMISAGILWLRAQLDEYVRRKLQAQKHKERFRRFDDAEKIFLGVLSNPNASADSREKARNALSKLNDYRTEVGLEIAKQTI